MAKKIVTLKFKKIMKKFITLNIVLLPIIIYTIILNDTATKKNIGAYNTMDDKYIIGDLGGVPVNIPRELVRLVEYDDDPDWGENRQGDTPIRTYQSKISSFGFDIRYTDGVFSEQSNEYDQQKNLPHSPWVSVGINSSNRYYGAGGINRLAEATINPNYEVEPNHIYERLPKLQYGLEVYAPPGIDLVTNKPWRENLYAEDIFIRRDAKGEVITYIKCSNRDVPHPPCTHYFDLEPDMKLDVYVSYSHYVLHDWQKIENIAKAPIKGFKK